MLAAAIQMTSTDDRRHNLERALALVEQAADRGAKLIGLPEVWEHVGPAHEKKGFAGALDGPQLRPLREFCTKRAVWLLAGSIAERAHDDAARIYNTAALISPRGEVVAAYRKMHLFDVDIPDGARYRESEAVAPGPSLPPAAEVEGLKAGLSVCYDLRFPELYRKLSDAGADVLCVPAAFTAYTGKAHWEVLLRARAIENQAYVLAPAQVGRIGPANENRFAYGHACIIDPWGEVLADAGGQGEGIALAKIEPSRIAQVRRDLPALKHRRRDLLG